MSVQIGVATVTKPTNKTRKIQPARLNKGWRAGSSSVGSASLVVPTLPAAAGSAPKVFEVLPDGLASSGRRSNIALIPIDLLLPFSAATFEREKALRPFLDDENDHHEHGDLG